MAKKNFWFNSFIWLVFVVGLSKQAKKKIDKSSIIEINDIKPFKKLQRTHTNLLVLFAQSERDASSRFEVLARVAEEIKGRGTVAYINCGESKDTKKMCKKLRVSPQPVVLKHYKDGDFNKDYDRRNTVKSMLNFMNDPTGEMPWEEEEGTEDVRHVHTSSEFVKLTTKEKKPIMVMFYAPWCGYCKKLKPDYAVAATELKGEAIMAGMDVDTYEAYQIREKFNITGFPTLIYFENGEEKYRYQGKHDKDSLVEWMRNPAPSTPPAKEEEWSDIPSDVVHLKDDTFDDFIANNPSVLVMFYAPWCGHCKAMKPEYTDAAKTMKEEEVPGVIAAVDATKETAVGKRFKIEGYPTVKYFKDGEFAFDVNERTADKIVAFMKDPKEPPPPPPPEKDWSEVESEVEHLTDDTFKGFLKKKKHVLVMFYAPWCGHCKKAKPEFMEAAKHDAENSKVAYAAVDCTVHRSVCNQFDVQGYPTFRYFNYGKKDFKYIGGRVAKDFIQFMENPREGPPPPPSEPEWKDMPSHVTHLTDDTFEEFVTTHHSVLVMFYAPWCGHCKAMKPAYMEAAEELRSKNARSVLAAVDCTKEKSLAQKYDVDGFPTIKYFRKGEFASEYRKARTKEDLVDFMLMSEASAPADAKTAKPEKPVEPAWSDEDTDVVHLTASTFQEFIKSHSSALVMFYAPWCPHCKRIKPEFSEVAKEVNTENKVPGALGAVDCTVDGDLCTEQEVKRYPTLKYYKDGEFAYKYTKKRKAEDMLAFMKDPQKPAPPPPPPDWSKESGKVHFLTNETWDSFMAEHPSVLVMFFAPWCGYCKAMKPNFFKAAEILSEQHPSEALAAVDCTKFKPICKRTGLKGYPTVKYYKNGEMEKDYDGDRSAEDIINFMKSMSGVDILPEETKGTETEKEESDGLKILTSANFESFLSETEHVLVMFFAPWCGHCQNAKPKFLKASEAFAEEANKAFTAVDCTQDSDLCDKQGVNGYPTIKYYRYGAFVVEYDGDRTEEDFLSFMKSPPNPLPPDQPDSNQDEKRDEL
ncbi:probable protein disulfide-isomerase A4 [Pocillopora verrucosa]|uniref:probable protein disulfide-isomerase A4 n=1 Tax=Pocillopora verrucosa TaxID=203993 RepID=UPI0033422CAD